MPKIMVEFLYNVGRPLHLPIMVRVFIVKSNINLNYCQNNDSLKGYLKGVGVDIYK